MRLKERMSSAGAIGCLVAWILVPIFLTQILDRLMTVIVIIALIALYVLLPLGLILLIFRSTRSSGAYCLMLSGFGMGLSQWFACAAYASTISKVWTIVGLLIGGVGIFPVSFVMMAAHSDWQLLIWGVLWLIGSFLLLTLGSRFSAPR